MIFAKNVNLTRLCRNYLTAYANISELRYKSCKNGPFCKNPNCPYKPKPVKPLVQRSPWDPPLPPSPCDSLLTNSCVSTAPKAPPSCCGDCPPSKSCNSPSPKACDPPPSKLCDPLSPKCCDPYAHILLDLPLIPFSPYDFPPCPCDYLPRAVCDPEPSPCDSPGTFESFYGSLKSDSQKLYSLEPLETSSDTQEPKCSLKEAPKEEPNASTCPSADLDKGKCVCIPDFRGGYELSSPEYFYPSQPQAERECTPTFPGDAKIPPSTPQPKELPENFSMGTATEFCRVVFQKCLDFCLRSLNRK